MPVLDPVDLVLTSPPYANQRAYGGNCDDWDLLVPPALSSINDHGSTQILVNLGLVHRAGEVVEYWEPLKIAMSFARWKLFGWYVWDYY